MQPRQRRLIRSSLVITFILVAYVSSIPPIFTSFATTPALDGSGSGSANSGTSGLSLSLTTTGTSDVIVVFEVTTCGAATACSAAPTISSVPTATGLTFSLKKSLTTNAANKEYVWYATDSSTFSGTITTPAPSATCACSSSAFGVSSVASLSSPFDSNTGANPTATGSSTSPSTTITTSNANDFIAGLVGESSNTAGTSMTFTVGNTGGSSATLINSKATSNGKSGGKQEFNTLEGDEYNRVTSTQSGSTISATLGTSGSWGTIGIAIAGATSQSLSFTATATETYSGSFSQSTKPSIASSFSLASTFLENGVYHIAATSAETLASSFKSGLAESFTKSYPLSSTFSQNGVYHISGLASVPYSGNFNSKIGTDFSSSVYSLAGQFSQSAKTFFSSSYSLAGKLGDAIGTIFSSSSSHSGTFNQKIGTTFSSSTFSLAGSFSSSLTSAFSFVATATETFSSQFNHHIGTSFTSSFNLAQPVFNPEIVAGANNHNNQYPTISIPPESPVVVPNYNLNIFTGAYKNLNIIIVNPTTSTVEVDNITITDYIGNSPKILTSVPVSIEPRSNTTILLQFQGLDPPTDIYTGEITYAIGVSPATEPVFFQVNVHIQNSPSVFWIFITQQWFLAVIVVIAVMAASLVFYMRRED